MQSTLSIGRAVGVANPVPSLVADLSEAGWDRVPGHERWLKRVVIPAEAGNRADTARELVRHLGVRPGEALDRAVSTLVDLTAVTGPLPDGDVRGLQVMIGGERWARPRE